VNAARTEKCVRCLAPGDKLSKARGKLLCGPCAKKWSARATATADSELLRFVEEGKPILDESVAALGLSRWAGNALSRNGLGGLSVRELAEFGRGTLWKLNGVGAKVVNDIVEALGAYGLSLKGPDGDWQAELSDYSTRRNFGYDWKQRMPDPKKLEVLTDLSYSIQSCCGICRNGRFVPGTDWGKCAVFTYEPEGAASTSKTGIRLGIPLSVHRAGRCASEFKVDEQRKADLARSGFDRFCDLHAFTEAVPFDERLPTDSA
jgi:hypothetical protein